MHRSIMLVAAAVLFAGCTQKTTKIYGSGQGSTASASTSRGSSSTSHSGSTGTSRNGATRSGATSSGATRSGSTRSGSTRRSAAHPVQSSTAPVDAAGGAVSDSSGDALTIPPGDFTAETTIEVEEGAHLVEPGCTECGEPVVFGPIGTTLLHPATLTIHYDDAEFPEGETVAHLVVWEDDGTGQPVELHPIAVDEIEHVVTIETEVLGTFECEIDPTFAVTTSTILVDSVDEVIDANGGTLVNAEGDAIVIPAGDFTDAIDVAIAPGSHLVEAGCTECGSPVAFGVAGTQLAQAATITVAYDELLVPAGETVSHLVVFEDDGQGNVTELHATSVDETHHTISVETTVLGTFEVELDPNAN